MLRTLFASRTWPYMVFRITVLSLLGWWLLMTCCLPGNAQLRLPWETEWARTDFSRHTIPLEEITSGGPPKDGIPAIDRPRFITPDTASRWLSPREPVIVVEQAGIARAYPLQILIYHEIVNDVIDGIPVTVTFCPLCYSSIVFDRRVKDEVLDFGTTGRVRKSDLVMYDRQTESWWQQFTGEGIVGRYAGTRLSRLPSSIASFETFHDAYPSGQVLSKKTGFDRPYGNNPYRGYDDITKTPFLFDDPLDPRLPPMERVLAIQAGSNQRIYPFRELAGQPVINDELDGLPILVLSGRDVLSAVDAGAMRESRSTLMAAAYHRRTGAGTLSFKKDGNRIIDTQTGSEWNRFGKAVNGPLKGKALAQVDSGIHFAFAWLAFRPETEIYRLQAGADN